MTLILLNGQPFDLISPIPCEVGQPLTAAHRAILSEIYVNRIRSRATYWLNKNPRATWTELQQEVTRLANAFVFDDEPEPDAIEREAVAIAEEIIMAKLAAEGLPPPRTLREHAEQLASDPGLLAQARTRVLARLTTAQDLLKLAEAAP